MALADFTLHQSSLAQSIVTRHTESAKPVSQSNSENSCGFHLERLVRQINPPRVRKIVGRVFGDLVRLLECLRPIESQLHQVDEAEETFALFQFIHGEASALVNFIEEGALTCVALDEELYDTLDGIAFAVSHDLQRVFETKLPGATEERTGRVVVGKLFRAHDVLTNCLQQATISLATMFDADLVGTALFHNSDILYRRSIQLCEDLSTLLNLVEACGETRREPAFSNLTAGIEKLRNESMERLRYSDWPQFESFCERIQLAITPEELAPVLHQFRCYVETLLGQVRMRAVLANVFPIEFGANDLQQTPSSAQNNTTQPDSPTDFQEESVTLDTLPIAV